MIDKELKANIKKTKEFITLWVKFHDLYKSATEKGAITHEEEVIFLETKTHITNKYKALKDTLKLNGQVKEDEAMDVMSHVLSLQGMGTISDDVLERIESSWKHSHAFLSDILKKLENQDREMAKRSVLLEFLKRVLSNRVVQFIILIFSVFFMFYFFNILIKLFFQ
ncbi:MAG: hypothetical protein COS99_00740 [Candidatus Omnitrophica bacterium CG07_land_8_20_14_0_80_42_15]|uniref:Uncharacterized protein n=1 Tax=Candidatus Aquitaenariimonas noxiae TaxID=1974741 RepID=A0A2J0KV22_9BACT|nr:MAG: hypothetical protein COS99_00740 [Candidatus Omnitrophica bacterium CG07_land_8_20_14_0_80_42_15]